MDLDIKMLNKSTNFPLEKILTSSEGEYRKWNHKDYVSKGVHVKVNDNKRNLVEVFASSVPKEAEVVVDYKFNSEYASGTALIPKQKEK